MADISEDLKEIVSTTIESIKEGMKGRETGVVGPIKFELAVIKSKGTKEASASSLQMLLGNILRRASRESSLRL